MTKYEVSLTQSTVVDAISEEEAVEKFEYYIDNEVEMSLKEVFCAKELK